MHPRQVQALSPGRRLPPPARRSAGLTLVELLVSIAIGLILTVAVISAYVGSAGGSRVAEAQGRMNEDAQAALAILTQQLRVAGNNPKQPGYAADTARNPVFGPNDYAIRGCDGTFTGLTTAGNRIRDLACPGGTGPDSIAIAYEADAANTVRNAAGKATDCLGQQLPETTVLATAPAGPGVPVKAWDATAGTPPGTGAAVARDVTFAMADNRFYIASANGIPSLYCKGNGGATPQPLVENVENMQIVYGLAPATATGSLTVAGYGTNTQMGDAAFNADLAALAEPLRWSKVATVRVCIVVRSEAAVAPDASSAQYLRCDGTLETAPPDLRLRRAYSTTVVLRNRVAS
jgi:type IV pilus assembly protein PilW